MGEKLVVGPINKGQKTDRLPFVIDNDSFPTLINAYQWRGRIKRKRGTSLLGRLNRNLGTTNNIGSLTVTITPAPTQGLASFQVGTDVFQDKGDSAGPTVTLLTNGTGGATLNYSTGVLRVITSIPNTAVIYYPTLPVMGLEDLALTSTQFPGTIAFDTKYSYNINTTSPYAIYDVSFYKNPGTPTYPGYTQKGTDTPISWNGQDYRQFWTTNYQGALWATNGIEVPFTGASIGMQYAGPTTTPALSAAIWGDPTTMQFTITGNTLVVGDFVFANEFTGGSGLNWQTGYVTVAGNTITVKFPNATIANAVYTPGILQYLTNRSNTAVDCIRWYDGDPTTSNNGWVNFMPPLSQGTFSIADLPAAIYYLVGARMIVPFKDRLLFLGPVIQTSTGSPIYLQDTIIYSQNGTPYYTASYTNQPSPTADTPISANIVFNPILVPANQTATSPAWFEDQTGFGGFISAGISSPILTVGGNEDVLIVGFDKLQTRIVYSGNDIIPFNIFIINSELGSSSTFSSITMDKGVITKGNRGYILTSQVDAGRIDLENPDQVFEVNLTSNGNERFTAQRDFINEWIYFTYPSNEVTYVYPNQTFQYNYRDNSWAIFNECYTTYGAFRKSTGLTWATLPYPTWSTWNSPWNSGNSTLLQPQVIAGTPQGFVMVRETDSTGEGNSIDIQNIVGSTITAPNHCLNNGDYITINGVLGAGGTTFNGKVFSIMNATQNTFVLNPNVASVSYTGGGFIQRMYVPLVQTKQFPTSWGMGRKTRIGPQQYLLTTADTNAQITLQIYLSQNSASSYSNPPIVPASGSTNNALVYSQVLYTCPESTNLGLTPANTNLQMFVEPTGVSQQEQIWHRVNTSLIGDTVQLGFTMSDPQMRALDSNGNFISQFAEIELHAFIVDLNPSSLLA